MVAGLAELPADLVDRRRQLVGGGGRDLDIGRGFVRRLRPRPRRAARSGGTPRTARSRSSASCQALSPTVRSMVSTRWRKAAIAASIMRAALLLLLHRGASRSWSCRRRSVMSWCVATQPPSAIGRLMTEDHAPGGRFDLVGDRLAFRHSGSQQAPVFHGIAREGAVGDAVFEQAGERAAGLHNVFRQLIQLHVAAVADHQSLVAVEHAEALRHVVDRDAHARVVGSHAPDDAETGEQHGQRRRQAAPKAASHNSRRRGDPGADRHGIVEQCKTCRETGAADQGDNAPIERDFRRRKRRPLSVPGSAAHYFHTGCFAVNVRRPEVLTKSQNRGRTRSMAKLRAVDAANSSRR